MNNKLLALTLVLLSNLASLAAPNFTPGNYKDQLPYQLYKPTNPDSKKLPLILFLHGAGERGSNNKSQLREPKQILAVTAKNPQQTAYILAPQCPKKQWWSGKNLRNVIALTKQIAKSEDIDPNRIYITGLSMGGYGTWSALAAEPDLFAAAIPICGGGNPSTARKFKHVPIQAYHGESDRVVTPDKSQKMIAALEKAKAKHATLTIYPNTGHNSWTKTYTNPKTYTWLFSNKKQ